MIRFKVFRASRILLLLAALVLLGVVAAIAARYALSRGNAPTGTNASLVQSTVGNGAKTLSVFALSAPVPSDAPDSAEAAPLGPTPAPAPRASVLIYHTHTHEAYEQDASDPYEAVEAWRTTDNDHSVVRVGRELARQLRTMGFEVVHDTTDHESNALSTAYTRSLRTLNGYDRSFDLYIDLHRDAWFEGLPLRYTTADGLPCAQPMLLIGNGNGFDVKPHFAENLAFARELTRRVNALQPGLCREVLVKDGRYNQHIGVYAVLIEVGHNKNTLKEALNTVPFLAEAIGETLSDALPNADKRLP